MWYDFLSMESQGCLVIFVAIKSRTFLMCTTQWSNTGVFVACLGVRVDLADLVSFYILVLFNHRVYIWQVRVCRVDLEEFVTLYITRRSNTELEHVKILAVDMDDYFDLKIIIFNQVFIACLRSFLLDIILGHLIIFSSHFICSLLKRKEREIHRVSWVLIHNLGLSLYGVYTMMSSIIHGVL